MGHAEPAPQGPLRGKGKLAPHPAFLEDLIAQDPDIALFELRDALAEAVGEKVHHSSIANLLSRLGVAYKSKEDQKTITGSFSRRTRWSPEGKTAARRLVQTSTSCPCDLAGSRCLH